MGEVRDRMEQDLFLRGVAANTRETYLRYAKHFVAFHRRYPRQLDTDFGGALREIHPAAG